MIKIDTAIITGSHQRPDVPFRAILVFRATALRLGEQSLNFDPAILGDPPLAKSKAWVTAIVSLVIQTFSIGCELPR